MQTVVNHFKKVGHRPSRKEEYFSFREGRLAFTLASFSEGPARGDSFVALSIAEFSL